MEMATFILWTGSGKLSSRYIAVYGPPSSFFFGKGLLDVLTAIKFTLVGKEILSHILDCVQSPLQ